MEHKIKVSVSKQKQEGLISCKSLRVRERILRLLLGKKQRLTILVPGENVEEVSIGTIRKGNMYE